MQKERKEPDFLVAPYIIRQGVTLLWAKRSVGKSALTWKWASSVGSGLSFFGLPVKQGKVLYVDVDSPENIIASRLSTQAVAPNVWFFIKPGQYGIPNPRKEVEDELRETSQIIKPDLVILNTLRKLHRLDDKDSAAPAEVYGYFQEMFPQAALVFVHHSKKSQSDPRFKVRTDETFSGSSHWIDDAHAAAYLRKYSDPNFNLQLVHVKSQGTAKIKPLPLKLDRDNGTTLTSPLFEKMLKVYTIMNESDAKGGALDEIIAKAVGVQSITAYKYRQIVERGKFPTSYHWMDRDHGDGDEDEFED